MNPVRILSFTLAFVLFSPGTPSWAAPAHSVSQIFLTAPKDGEIAFKAIGHPSALKVIGKGSGPTGSLTLSGSTLKGRFDAELSPLETGFELRDQHMKEKYLEVATFPKAALTLDENPLTASLDQKGTSLQSIPFRGMLEFHGKKASVQGVTDLKRESENEIDLESKFTVKLSDFGISIPKWAGITMADEVEIKVTSKAKRSP